MSDPREIEAKFDVDAPGRDVLLKALTVGRFVVGDRRTAVQEDIYFDTRDAKLKDTGATLRVRRSKGGARMTYKGPREADASESEAHIVSRFEDEVPLTAEQNAAVTIDTSLPDMDGVGPLDRARSVIGNDDLFPVALLQNTRTTILLRDADGATLELAVDDCVGTRLRDGRVTAFDEVELESKSADRLTLIEAAEDLQTLVPSLRPSRLTKLGRTLD